MARRDKIRDAAVKIGAAVGRVEGTAHKAAKKATNAVHVAKKELAEVSKQIEALKKQLAKSTKRLQSALR